MDSSLNFDKNHLFHPYTSVLKPQSTVEVVSAKGVYLELSDGKKLVDGMSSWWSAIHGYQNKTIEQALKHQLKKIPHVMFGGITHQPAIELGKKLISILPKGLEHIFYCDSGSVAVEVAMKMALQYQIGKGSPQKSRFLALKGGYHGDTFFAMSVCDPETGIHSMWKSVLPKQYFAPRPEIPFGQTWSPDAIVPFKKILEKEKDKIAAVILEPVVQGAGGMWFYSPEYLKKIRELCSQAGVLLIADEIATGFGRTGKLFACEWAGISPDIICIGKAITGGTLSFAATVCTKETAEGVCSNGSVLMHGPTFMANPLAAAAASASIEVLLNGDWEKKVQSIETQLQDQLLSFPKGEAVSDVRVLGAIGVIEMKNPVDQNRLMKEFISRGVWIRPFGKAIYCMPPYTIRSKELTVLTKAMKDVAEKLRRSSEQLWRR